MSGSHALPPRWPPQCSCVVIESSFDPGERLQAPGSLWSYIIFAFISEIPDSFKQLADDENHSFYVVQCTDDSPLYSVQSLAGHYLQVYYSSLFLGWSLFACKIPFYLSVLWLVTNDDSSLFINCLAKYYLQL